METTCDAFLDGRLHLTQPKSGFRSGLDAVFLAAACRAKAGDRVLEAGCGAGAAALCLLTRVEGIHVTGVEIDRQLADLAKYNAQSNGLDDQFHVVIADVTSPWTELEAAGLAQNGFDYVIANPPYYKTAAGRTSPDQNRARACTMPEGGLARWVRFLAASAKSGGTLVMIHTPDALNELLTALEDRFGEVIIKPIYPKQGGNAIRLLITGVKGSRAPLSIACGIVLHEADGQATNEARAVLRHGKSI